jgi:hypothetical protein
MQSRKIPILDLNLSAFQHLHGNTPELVNQGGRVVFMFNSDDAFYKLSELYNSNISIAVLDMVNAQRELKSKMLSMKGQHKENEKRNGFNHEVNFNR